MFKVFKDKSVQALSWVRAFFTLRYIVCIILILAVFFVLDRIADRKLNEQLPAFIDHIRKTSGLHCEVLRIAYNFPTTIRAHSVRVTDDDGREWLNASHITAEISPFRYLMNRKIGRHLIRSFDALNLEVTLYHGNKGGWEFPQIRKSSANPAASAESEDAHINLNIRNLTVNFQTAKRTSSRTYKTVIAGIDLRKGLDSLEITGDDERLSLTVKREAGEFDLQADSFGLAILAPFLGDAVPLSDM